MTTTTGSDPADPQGGAPSPILPAGTDNKPAKPAPPDVSEADVLPTEHTGVLEHESDLIAEIKETADKLARDKATRGDLKILSRALKELRYAFKIFTPYRKQRKVTVFGSARTPAEHAAYQHSVKFGRRMAEEGWMVLTGAGNGIMEGAHVGAGKEMSMGVNIMLPFEQAPNYVIFDDQKLVHLKYFFTRKLLFVKEVHAVALFPGGFGTLDEGFEIMTLVQTGKRDMMPIVFIDQPGGNYWNALQQFINDQLLANALISPEDLSLYKITEDIDTAVNEIMQFYSVYNSMRYIRDRLILRLHKTPSDEFIERLNDEFGDIALSPIERSEVHRLEADDVHLKDLARISFRFNRKSLGRLRQMIDLINVELGKDA